MDNKFKSRHKNKAHSTGMVPGTAFLITACKLSYGYKKLDVGRYKRDLANKGVQCFKCSML
jgi:hypothetical protein